jgi:predicted RNase H-like HicB family nuclease
MLRSLFGRQPREITFRINVVVEPDGEGCFHAFAPAFRGLHVDGGSEEEALKNLLKGISLYIQSLEKHGDPLPIGADLSVDEQPHVPQGAFLRSVTLQWPSLNTSGIR